MTRSSSSRRDRRAQKADLAASLPTVPKSIVTFEELEGGGFTFGLGLYGALLAEMNPNRSVPVSVVDIMALSIAHLIKTNSKDLADANQHVLNTLHLAHKNIEAGNSVEEVFQDVAGEVAEATPAEESVQS